MNVLRLYWPFVYTWRGRATASVAFGGGSALLEAAALMALLPILAPDVSHLLSSELARTLALPHLPSAQMLQLLAISAFLALGAMSAIARYMADALALGIKTDIEKKTRSDMTDALLAMSWPRFIHLNQGDISKSLVAEGLQIATGVHYLIVGVTAGVAAGCYFVAAIFVSAPVAAMAIAFAVISFGIHKVASLHTGRNSKELSHLGRDIGEVSTAIFGNLKYFRATGFEDVARARARAGFDRFAQTFFDANIQPLRSRTALEILSAGFIAAFIGIQIFVFEGSAAEALIALGIFYRMAPRVLTLQSSILQALSLTSWAATYQDRLKHALAHPDRHSASGCTISFASNISFDRVSFGYQPGQLAVANVTLDIPWGEHIAFVGASGSGKSTLMDLVTGLLTPHRGKILIDGIDLASCDRSTWRRQIGIVMQDSMLMNDTVARNVAFGAEQPDEKRVVECLMLANAWGFVSEFAGQIHEPIADRGARLSGGQRQRMAIARALYHRPGLLILDEATSALDSASEREFQSAIERLQGELTILSIAHRLQTVRKATSIHVLERGVIIESGDWESLLARRGEFYRAYTLQQQAPNDRSVL